MNTKVCFKCETEKVLPEFYKHSKMSDGYLGKCKDCTKNDTKKRCEVLSLDGNWIEKEKERQREKSKRLGYGEKYKPTYERKKLTCERYDEKYPEKKLARCKSSNLKSKTKGNHLHHWSYNEQHVKDVIELPKEKHAFIHRHMEYDQQNKMYKSKTGELLDTKEKHINYINSLN